MIILLWNSSIIEALKISYIFWTSNLLLLVKGNAFPNEICLYVPLIALVLTLTIKIVPQCRMFSKRHKFYEDSGHMEL